MISKSDDITVLIGLIRLEKELGHKLVAGSAIASIN
jgi:hypothetical protein